MPRIFKPYLTKTELAMEYMPEASVKTARARLMSWITSDKMLMQRLEETGYHTRQHTFTNTQIKIIKEFLGDPS